MASIVRAQLFHTPADPFFEADALESFDDGAVAFDDGVITASGDYRDVSAAHPDATVLDRRGSILLPGFVDTHVHYPQVPVIGTMGLTLLNWLEQRTLPHEERFSEEAFAREQARVFLGCLAANGTTTALVFGAHFAGAMNGFFAEADRSGLRICAGVTVADRLLTQALLTTPERAVRDSVALIERWHLRGRLRYAVTPRFALSCSEELLAACGEVFSATTGLLFTSHINETVDEVGAVAELFPSSDDYLGTYERHRLVTRQSVLAHNVHPTQSELTRLAAAEASVAHCPSSNIFLGSGLFPLRAHVAAGVRVSLGSDVGGGTGLSMLKEGLCAYEHQMLLGGDGQALNPEHLLYLSTRAGALALGLSEVVGDFSPGRAADLVLITPPERATLSEVLRHSSSAQATLGALFALAREESIAEVYVAGEPLPALRQAAEVPEDERDG